MIFEDPKETNEYVEWVNSDPDIITMGFKTYYDAWNNKKGIGKQRCINDFK